MKIVFKLFYCCMQAQNINSCNNGSDWSDRKLVRVIWRRGRGMCGSRSGPEAAAVVDGSPGNSLILVNHDYIRQSILPLKYISKLM